MSAIINIETKSVESQSHRVYPVSWNGDGWYPILPEIETQVVEQAPYLDLTIEPVTFETDTGEEVIKTTVKVVTGFTATEQPLEEILATLIGQKVEEISTACEQAIYAGCDVEIEENDGETTIGHFSLTESDQINIATATTVVNMGAEKYPYHADGEKCRMYSKENIKRISTKATEHKLLNTTYCNHLLCWARSVTTVEELEEITWGATLPEELKANMEEILYETTMATAST